MSETAEKEPTMEEILASIRRIISEDGADEETSAPQEQAAPVEAPSEDEMRMAETAFEEDEPADMEPAEDPARDDDVLELTDFAEAEDVFEEPFETEAAVPAFETEEAGDDGIVSGSTEEKAGASFAELSAMLVGGYEGAGNTLEGLVRDMLKPMLRAWLDENLPRIVEDMVEREIARIAARKGRK